MSVQIKVYNLPQSGWDLIGLSDFLPTQNDVAITTNDEGRTTEQQPNTYEITITVQLPTLPSVRGLLSNLLSSFGVSSQNDNNNITTLSEDNDSLISDLPLVENPLIDNNVRQSLTESKNTSNNNTDTHFERANNVVVEKKKKLAAAQLVLSSSSGSPQSVEPAFLSECREFIEAGLFELCEEGVGGTYFIKDLSGSIVAVFKPNDEEPGAASNPKDLVQQPLLPPGGGYLREMAAYLLDTHRFAGVPETFILTNVSHAKFATSGAKTGSLQRYVKNDGASTDQGSNAFDIEGVHRIGLLDLRIFNLDRNGENLLVHPRPVPSVVPGGKPTKGLVPIDHTFSLPPITSLDSAYFEWHFWSQAKKPFSKESLDYIRQIDIERDAKLLRALGIPESSIMTMIAMSLLLKEVAGDEDEAPEKTRWTLFDIANFVARLPPSKPSKLEDLIDACRAEATSEGKAVDANAFLVVLREKLREIFSQPPQAR